MFKNHLYPKIYITKLIIYIFSCWVFLGACKKENDIKPTSNWEYLEDTLQLASISVNSIKFMANLAGYGEFNSYFKYSISIYKINYYTEYQGKDLLVSGLICIPKRTPNPPPIMEIGNGLFFSNQEAPTSFSLPNNFIGYEFVASLGYIALIPDLIGFGESKDILFPAYNYKASTAPMIDMIYASKEFLAAKGIETNEQLFLAGYSHGAYVAGATLKAIEENPEINLSVTATAIGAGGYNIYSLMEHIMNGTSYEASSYLALLFTSYNAAYQWNRPLTDFYKQKYAEIISGLLDGNLTRPEIEIHLTSNLDSLFNTNFLQGLRSGNETQIINAFIENSIHDWKPLSPLRMYHSPNDERIPLFDSEEAYNNMINKGATSVEFFEITGDDHFNSVFNFMDLVLPWFEIHHNN